MEHVVRNDVKQINDYTYSIPSESDPKILYTINTEFGVCSCKIGCAGAFCKHQAWIHENLKIQLPNLPPVTLTERHALGLLALGNKCPEAEFFLGLKEYLPDTSANNEVSNIKNDVDQNTSNEKIELPLNIADKLVVNVQSEIQINTDSVAESDTLHEWSRLQKMIPSLPSTILQKLTQNLKNIKTNQQFASFIHSVNTSARTINRRGKIRVQPTSISRRICNITRGSKRIPAGRRPEHNVNKGKLRRSNNLSQSVSKNIPNAKKHGRGH